jgi:hypothetical protein
MRHSIITAAESVSWKAITSRELKAYGGHMKRVAELQYSFLVSRKEKTFNTWKTY